MEAHIYEVRRILNLNVFSVDIKFWDPVACLEVVVYQTGGDKGQRDNLFKIYYFRKRN